MPLRPRVRKPGIRLRVLRVGCDRLFKASDRLECFLPSSDFARSGHEGNAHGQPVRPHGGAAGKQLRQSAAPAHREQQQRSRPVQLSADFSNVLRLSLESNHRSPRHHLQPGDRRHRVDDFLSETIAEVYSLSTIGAHAHKGQDGHRRALRPKRRRFRGLQFKNRALAPLDDRIVCVVRGIVLNNAARVWHGAGLRLVPNAGMEAIRKGISRLLLEPGFRDRAQMLGEKIARDAAESRAIPNLEETAARKRPS